MIKVGQAASHDTSCRATSADNCATSTGSQTKSARDALMSNSSGKVMIAIELSM